MSCLLAAGSTQAQFPGFPSPFPDPLKATAKAAPAAPAETREQAAERLRRLLAEVEAERAAPAPAPPGIGEGEIADLADARSALVNAYEVQLATLEQVERARAARATAEAQARDWRGFDDKPPYSILFLDELRDAAEAARQRLATTERALAHLQAEAARNVADGRTGEETLRRLQEAYERAQGAQREQAAWRRSLAEVRLRLLGSRAAVTQQLIRYQNEEAATRQAEIDLLQKKIAAAAAAFEFTEGDLAKAKERLATQSAAVRAERRALAGRLGPREKERAAAEQALAALRERGDARPEALRVAEARLRAAETWVATLRMEGELLDGLAQLDDDLARAWDARRVATVATGADARREGAERLRTTALRLARWRGYVENLVDTQKARIADATAAAARADVPPGVLRHEQDAIVALQQGAAAYERVRVALAGTLRTLERWRGELDARDGAPRGASERLADRWSALKAGVNAIWTFELFAVEDTAIVDGQEVKASRGVTVGKSIGAFLVFAVGYWFAAVFARRVERGLVARGFDPRRVRNYRRWLLIAVAGLLALFTLNVARIPLTVFAFLGGALAIGVGFGTQTIIRNFISGLILLAERRIQIGDIIEVDGVTGTVTAVDLRSSTVLGFDGVETAVPNATLLENKVTNWTHSDKRVRRTVKVGVAYGSPLREVADILDECAKRHGVVLEDPPPVVVLEDFGADALVFALYFWVELRTGVSAMQVASDLRFMIAKRFAETGIEIAFPQRDVHLDASKPLRVEIAAPPALAGRRAAA